MYRGRSIASASEFIWNGYLSSCFYGGSFITVLTKRSNMEYYQLELYQKDKNGGPDRRIKKFKDIFLTESEANLFATVYLSVRGKKSLKIKRIKNEHIKIGRNSNTK